VVVEQTKLVDCLFLRESYAFLENLSIIPFRKKTSTDFNYPLQKIGETNFLGALG